MGGSKFTRRDFFKTGAVGGASLLMMTGGSEVQGSEIDYKSMSLRKVEPVLPSRYHLDLTPAKWIWYPSQRTLANTFILFRKSVYIHKKVRSARGWVLGDSRYLLYLNGNRIQWGPPPADPRFTEADPVDLTNYLSEGENVLGANVLYYGYGDGTWPLGKPGFIFYLQIQFEDGSEQLVISDKSWTCKVARSWKPGQYKRWYLRALQEEFDARKYPYGWNEPQFEGLSSWLDAQELTGPAMKTATSTNSSDYMYDSSSAHTTTELRKRTIPMIKEHLITQVTPVEAVELKWKVSPEEHFEMIVPDAYAVINEIPVSALPMSFELNVHQAVAITLKLEEQIVGWPFFQVSAPEGTIIELMVQEGHRMYMDGGPALINNHFHSWTRFICREGDNTFETFDFESVKWIQLHIHHASGKVEIKKAGVRRRLYDWPYQPNIKTSDTDLNKIIKACINTTYNNSLYCCRSRPIPSTMLSSEIL
jgi:hypothetical protein